MDKRAHQEVVCNTEQEAILRQDLSNHTEVKFPKLNCLTKILILN